METTPGETTLAIVAIVETSGFHMIVTIAAILAIINQASERRGGIMVSTLESGSSAGRGHCVVFLGHDTLLSQCLSPPRSINGYCQGNLRKCRGVTCDRQDKLASLARVRL